MRTKKTRWNADFSTTIGAGCAISSLKGSPDGRSHRSPATGWPRAVPAAVSLALEAVVRKALVGDYSRLVDRHGGLYARRSLESFYRGWIAGYLNVLFLPMTALMVLGVGYVRARLDSLVGQGDGVPLSHEEAQALAAKLHRDQHERMMEMARAHANPMDPRSGPLWIGNPMNPNNPGYVNPHTGKHH